MRRALVQLVAVAALSTGIVAPAQSSLEAARKKLSDVDAIAQGEATKATAGQIRKLLGEARDLCAEASRAADTQNVCVLRFELAKRAIGSQEWELGAQLTRAALPFATKTFPDHAYRWAIQESLAACLTNRVTDGDKLKDVKEAETLLRPVVAYYAKRVRAAAESGGIDPIPELDALGRTRTLLGTAIGQDKDRRSQAAREIWTGIEVLLRHGRRVPDPRALRDLAASYLDHVTEREAERAFRAVLGGVEQHFPRRWDLQAFCRGEVARLVHLRGDAKNAVDEARKVIELVRGSGVIDVRRDGWTAMSAARILRDSGLNTEALAAFDWLNAEYAEAGVPLRDEEYFTARTARTWCVQNLQRYEQALALRKSLYRFAREVFHERESSHYNTGGALATLLQTLGKKKRALDLITDVVRKTDRFHSPQRPIWARQHNNRAWILRVQGRYAEALTEVEKVLEVDPSHTGARINRGLIHRSLGDPDAALAEFLQVREQIAAAVEREQDAEVHGTWRNTLFYESETLRLMGDYAAALSTAEERLRITRRWIPGESLSLAAALFHAGGCRRSAGDFRGAIQVYEEAARIYVGQLHTDGVSLQYVRNRLAWCRMWVGELAAAETLARQALDSLRRSKWTGHVQYATAMRTLGEVLARRGQWNEARVTLESAIETARAVGTETDERWCRAALATVAQGEGKPREAVQILRDAIAVEREQPYPEPHLLPHWRRQLLSIAATSSKDELRDELRAVLVASQRRLDRLWFLSLRARSEAVAVLSKDAQLAAAIRRGHPESITATKLFEWFATLRVAAGPLETRSWRGANRAVRELHDELLRARRRVATLAHIARAEEQVGDSGGHRTRLREASEARDAIERKLNDAVPAKSRFAWITVSRVAERLAFHKAVAVAVHRVAAVAPFQNKDHYVAFVVDKNENVRLTPLRGTEPIDTAIADWRKWASGGDRGRAAGKKVADPGAVLRAKVVDKVVDKVLKGLPKGRVFLTLDGALNTVAWDALPAAGDGKRFIGDDYHIAVLPSFRSLLESGRRRASGTKLLLVGDVDYGAKGKAPAKAKTAPGTVGRGGGIEGPWMPLPGSSDEIRVIQDLFQEKHKPRKAEMLKKGAATKAALFERVESFTHLHVSTHGYFADPREGAKDGGHDVLIDLAPMTLCGLVLAGANNKPGPMEERVGIATAEELVGIDLAACELAVLSGCQTNLGVRRAGQGLASLQAALHAAGARTAITSLWRVPDEATSTLMQKFYYHMWVDKDAPDRALWKARKSLANEHPKKWAGWVFSGVPARNLDRRRR